MNNDDMIIAYDNIEEELTEVHNILKLLELLRARTRNKLRISGCNIAITAIQIADTTHKKQHGEQ